MKKASDKIIVKGARQHNLKDIDVTIPRDQFVVINLKDIPGSITKFPAFSKPTDTPYPCKQAISTVPYLVI